MILLLNIISEYYKWYCNLSKSELRVFTGIGLFVHI